MISLVLQVSFATFRCKETNEIEIGDQVQMTLEMQQAVPIEHTSIGSIYATPQSNKHMHTANRQIFTLLNPKDIYAHLNNLAIKGWQKGTKCLIFVGLFLQKSPIISGSFAERDLQLKASCASSPHCSMIEGLRAQMYIGTPQLVICRHTSINAYIQAPLLRYLYIYAPLQIDVSHTLII